MVLVRVPRATKWRLAFLIGIIGIAGVGAGLTLSAAEPARPGSRTATKTQAFRSGGERSVPILREIAEKIESGNERSETLLREIEKTLERIDARLEKIENAALSAAAKKRTSRPASPNMR